MSVSMSEIKPWYKNYKPVQEWQYLKIKIWSDEDLDVEITELSFRMSIEQALTTVFGRVGAASYVNILDWNQYEYVGIIKVKQSDLTTVWSALISHQFSVTNKACTLDIISSSANLISLAN